MIIDRALLESVLNEEHISEGVEVKGKDHYEFANGKRPSGRGHWMFGLGPKSNHQNEDGSIKHNHVFQHYGMFTTWLRYLILPDASWLVGVLAHAQQHGLRVRL